VSGSDVFKIAVFLGLVGFVLARNLPGARLFLRPGFTRWHRRTGPETDPVARHGVAVRDMLGELDGLGFEVLGTGAEHRPLAPAREEIVLGSRAEHSYAIVRPVQDEAFLHFLAPFEDGSVVITADHLWPAADEDRYLAGGLPGSTPAQLLNAHRRRVARFLELGRPPSALSLEARGRLLEAFYATGPGRTETRRREVKNALLAAVALGFVGMLLKQLLGRY
jgi:hypothetical protein